MAERRPDLMPLQVRDLRLRLGTAEVLRGLSFALGPDGCTVIMGPNGAGKSLLLRVLHGVLRPYDGAVSWAGQAPVAVTRRQALVFQQPVLLRRSVAANVDFVLGRGHGARRDALLAHVGLAHKAAQPARQLSGGEAQRLALARALAADPAVLMLDEPTASLDPGATLAIERIVSDARAAGTRILLVTHDAGQARRMADDVLFLSHGRLTEHSPADLFFDQPQSRAARDYLNGVLSA